MTTEELCALLAGVCCKIIVLKEGRRESFGTGVLITPSGVLLTALHVVADEGVWRGETFAVQLPQAETWYTYRPLTEPNFSINTGAYESKPFALDISILEPTGKLPVTPHYTRLRRDLAPIGTQAMMAGYSDDIYWPFNFENSFDKRKFEGIDKEKEFKEKEHGLRQLLCKRSMVGSRFTIKLSKWGSAEGTQTAAYTLDNDISFGGSGGAAVDSHGKLIGIISKRGLGSAAKFGIPTIDGGILQKLPTGTAHVLGHSIATALLPVDLRCFD